MNERIRELAEQAGIVFWEISGDVDWRQANREHLEKFAELIVRRCARIIINGGYWTDILGNRKNASPDEIAQMIKEHFGVEE